MKKPVKKALKITGITLLSLVGVILIAFAIVSWFVFTPEKLTPMVNQQLPNFITCPTEIGNVELTLFKTFPDVGLKINGLLVVNPTEGAPSDTVANVESCVVAVNLMEFLKHNAIVVKEVTLDNGFANVFIDQNGNSNLDIFPPSENTEDTTSSFSLESLNVNQLALKNMRIWYNDYPSGMFALLNGVYINADASLKNDLADGDIHLKMNDLLFQMKDSVSTMEADLTNVSFQLSAKMKLDKSLSDLNLQLTTDSISYVMTGENDFYLRAESNEMDLAVKGSGPLANFNGDVKLVIPSLLANYAKEDYLKSAPLSVKMPLNVNLDEMKYALKNALIRLYDLELGLDGAVQLADNGDIPLNMNFRLNELNLDDLLSLLPKSMKELVAGMNIAGLIGVSGTVSGVYNDSTMPLVTADLQYKNGTFAYPEVLPYTFNKVQTSVSATLDLNETTRSEATIHQLTATTGENYFEVSGKVQQLLDNMLCNMRLKTKLKLADWEPMLPEDLNARMNGRAEADFTAQFSMPQIEAMALDKMTLNGNIKLSDFDLAYNDSLFAQSSNLTMTVQLPAKDKSLSFNQLMKLVVEADHLNANMVGTGKATLGATNLTVGVSNFMDEKQPLAAAGNFRFAQMNATMDDMNIETLNSGGDFSMMPAKQRPKNIAYTLHYNNDALQLAVGDSLSAKTGKIALSGSAEYDENEGDIFLQWHPNINVNFKEGELSMAQIPYPVQIPTIEFDFTPERFHFKESSIVMGNSQFGLSGNVSNIENFWKNEGMLVGEMDFVSEQTDLDQLMELANGFGSEDSTATAEVMETESPDDDPFMVPLGVDFRLNTLIKNVKIGTNTIRDVGGHLAIKDGVLVLEEYGFTSEAAKMQLTALYRSPRKNHLFVGLDFHLLDINIDSLIHLIPTVDTLVPMLKSFEGNAEFHLAAETYLKSNYELKMSTLRGAAALEGHDLYLEEGEAFNKIAGYFMFDKKGKTKVDSLNIEMTVFRNEIDLYPFLIVMDKFKAIVGGRHNLDMNCDYHVSLVDSPLPVRLGLDIKGNVNDFDNMKFNLVKPKYSNLYRPKKQGKREEQTLQLKKLISESLKKNVKE